MSRLNQTPSQTVGPFFSLGMPVSPPERSADAGRGRPVRIEGGVFDGAGAPIEDSLIEMWQANADGQYETAGSSGFLRVATGAEGRFVIDTVKPGSADAGAPHLNVCVFARGMLIHAFTRMYFSDDDPVARDPLFARIDPARRQTIVGERVERAAGENRALYRWDIHMQGDRETVFFDA